MRYLVIGEPCVDVIHKINGEIIHSYGGILYSVIALSVISSTNDVVVPVMNLGEDEYENITRILSKYPNIDRQFISKVVHSTRKVYLDYSLYNTDKKARFETSTEPTYAIDYKLIESALPETDAVLVNMVSGVDINFDTMEKLRESFSGFIYIDIHNLVMKTCPDGTRVHTNLENWKKWCTSADVIQMNEFEVKTLDREIDNEYEIVDEVLIKSGKDVKAFVITRGINGVSCYTKRDKTFGGQSFVDLDKIDLSAIENPHFVDSTGCGDIFAASFTYDYSKNNDIKKSLHFANRTASFATSLEGIDDLYKLR
ncbi:MAG: carbohydrate kinase family protein [Ignavibacteriaceae bacterium]|mgnify:CR=1 FL=1|jgi:Sugar kinases, ribokinase family|nr:MAG: carbohydrate kinase family protein [Chlorobiota bacterium]KXK06313.1 MAG: PfkB family carbohydrate kinase [Chlorobi bacterium OLB4]MBV6399174.1 hypothetical protein [Ignavibacteria bacterium]MCC6885379.1 carbohydrate kinase family protein [Ignavibacteriales bacterium]MCE7953622.1 carbohydrate kinase family protein [Chlorobi bacterium CHB7]MDL1887488.1 carbohydrate kinase family protein [Ignavibacteria bacterium CHB1]MEB2329962.1 carbohydrate kinase family protein [Ignavibacteriaceae b